MIRLFIISLLLISGYANAQTHQKKVLKIAFLGDSFCGGGNASTFDSFWIGKVVTHYKVVYDTVIYYKLCTGGETTYKALPYGSYFPAGHDFYSKPDSNRNIEKVLQVLGSGLISDDTARFCYTEYSGNDAWLGYYADSIKKNLATISNFFKANGIEFTVSGMAPRQQSGLTGNFLADHYYLTADTLNAALPLLYPDNFSDVWTGHERPPENRKRLINELANDSVHLIDYGHRLMFVDMVDNYVSDKFYCNCKGRATSFTMTKVVDSLRITSNIIGSRITVSGSNDYISFVPIKTFRYSIGDFDNKVYVYGNTYLWYKIQIESGFKKIMTKTLKINY